MLRRHPLTGEPILYAPERGARPRAFLGAAEEERCPFCPGHEADTPPELARVAAAAGDPWRVRVVPNKYPPADDAEVIVESPRHTDVFHDVAHGGDAVRTYAERYAAHADAAYIALFKNHGERAGSSLAHIHSQLVPLPFVPPRIAKESEAFARAKRCPVCAIVDVHRDEALTLRETESFVWLTPWASWMPYQQWLVPKRHVPDMMTLASEAAPELASLLRDASAAMTAIAPAYNWTFVNFRGVAAAHAYVDLFPRVANLAGLELGTGAFIQVVDPSAAARRLRRRP
jgi:UDPglucose--hexose-1-phosphate uridylyltransferase